jgi:molybdopterin molybdotransferase
LATVGKDTVHVKKLPTISVISTGNELVDIDQVPLAHQIRKSNSYSLAAALQEEGILPLLLHMEDDMDMIRPKLAYALQEIDVLILSGGVSKGKFDFIPEVLAEIGVIQIFHRVLQRPGKPFWFGFHPRTKTLIFSFPGNPVSTFVCYQAYFKAWLKQSLGLPVTDNTVLLNENLEAHPELTLFLNVRIHISHGILYAERLMDNGSGDLTTLAQADGFIILEPSGHPYKKGDSVPFLPIRKIV